MQTLKKIPGIHREFFIKSIQNTFKIKYPVLLIRSIFILSFLFFSDLSYAQVKISSWNLQNFGKTKSDSEINFVADVLNEYDVVGLQEIVAGYGGIQAVAKLADALNRKGSKWDYVVSDPM